MSTHEDGSEGMAAPEAASEELPPALEELVRAATRMVLGSAGIALTSARRWQHEPGGQGEDSPASGAATLTSAALGLGLQAEHAIVRTTVAAGSTAASVTWGVVHASPLRGPVERLAERFRSERRLSEREVSGAVDAILEALSEAILSRVDLDRVIDRIALERVLARMDRRELAERIAHDGSLVR